MKQIRLQVGSKDYNITLEDDFAPFFENEFTRVFENNKLLDTKELLNAFVQLTYEKFKNNNLQKNIIKNIENNILSNN